MRSIGRSVMPPACLLQSCVQIAASRSRPAGLAQCVEPLPLLLAQRVVEVLQRRAHDLHRLERALEPFLGGVEPADRGKRDILGARGRDDLAGLRCGRVQFVERCALRGGRMHRPLICAIGRSLTPGARPPQLCIACVLVSTNAWRSCGVRARRGGRAAVVDVWRAARRAGISVVAARPVVAGP